MEKVLFVCVENSCRSQMAEAFAKIAGKDTVESYSAGSRAAGEVNQTKELIRKKVLALVATLKIEGRGSR